MTVAAVLSLTALPVLAQTTDVPAAQAGVTADAAPQANTDEVAAMLANIDRAGRDTAPRSRVVEARGQNAGGLGNVTAQVEVAGGVPPVTQEVSVSGSASVETGKH